MKPFHRTDSARKSVEIYSIQKYTGVTAKISETAPQKKNIRDQYLRAPPFKYLSITVCFGFQKRKRNASVAKT